MMYAFITVRVGSSRLWGKCLMPFGAGNVLQHVIRRAKWYGFTPIVCTSTHQEDNAVYDYAKREACLIYRGSAKDILERWLGACDEFHIDAFHYIGADDAFFDGELGKAQLKLLERGYDIVYPPTTTYVGSCAFSMTSETVRKACAIKDSKDTETFWPYVEKIPKVKAVTLPVDARIPDIRLTLDYSEDYWMLMTVLRILGSLATRQQIEDLFIRNPDLYKINWFRNEEFKKRQQEKERKIREGGER